MAKIFNVNGACNPDRHYMVNLLPRLREIHFMIQNGDYFTINRARQYGKTTLLKALARFLSTEYLVVSLDFQKLSHSDFSTETAFVQALSREIIKKIKYTNGVSDTVQRNLIYFSESGNPDLRMAELFDCFSQWCLQSSKPVILIIDEVDSATNNQVFLDFLSQLRAAYLDRDSTPTFQSVILAGVYDVRNIRQKLRPDEEHRRNSPWNIAADFLVDLSFTPADIAGMLKDYEADHHTGMDIDEMSSLLFNYTSGYPYLVSKLCKLIDERIYPTDRSAWSKDGFLEAVKMLLNEKNTLFESLVNKLADFPRLRTVIYDLLFTGKPIPYVALNRDIEIAAMFGFIRNDHGNAVISNRIFETVLYNLFISEEYDHSRIYDAGVQEKNQFIISGHLNVRKVLERFIETFHYLYGDQNEAFLEKDGRKYFMLFLKPIINGVGNCYIEAETRNHERMDMVIDYRGEQYIIELKIWHGDSYNRRGEEQLINYLDYFHLKKGYMLSFNFNKNKEPGIREIVLGDKLLIEAVV